MRKQELTRSEKNFLVKQSNAITESRHSMTAIEQNIMYMLISQLRDDDPEEKLYSVRVSDLEKLTNKPVDYSYLNNSRKKLLKRVYFIRVEGELIQFPLLTVVKYEKGVMKLKISEKIRPFFFMLKNNYTKFQLQIAVRLRSKYAKRLYEMLSQFKNTGIFKTSVLELKERLALVDLKTGREEYEKFGLFATKVLEVAKKEINEHTDISFDYTTKKTGRKITHLEFKIRSKTVTKELPETTNVTSKISPLEAKLVDEFKVSKVLAKDVINSFPAEKIEGVMKGILKENQAGKINKLGAYSKTIFEEWLNGAEPTFEKTDSKIKHVPIKSDIQNGQIAVIENKLQKRLSSLGLGRNTVYVFMVKYGGDLESLEKLEAAVKKVELGVESQNLERNPDVIYEVLKKELNGESKQINQPLVAQLNERSNSINSLGSLLASSIRKPSILRESAEEEMIRREKTVIWEELIGRFRMDSEEADELVEVHSPEVVSFAIAKVVEGVQTQKIPQESTTMIQELKKQLNLA